MANYEDNVSIEQEYPTDIYAEEEAQKEIDLESKISVVSERYEISENQASNLGNTSYGLMLDDQPSGLLNHNWDGREDRFWEQENMEDGMRIASEDSIRSILNNELGAYLGYNRVWSVWREKNAWKWTTDMRRRTHLSTMRASRRIYNISKA